MKRDPASDATSEWQSDYDAGHAMQRHVGRRSAASQPLIEQGTGRSAHHDAIDHELRSIAFVQAALDVRTARCLRAVDRDATWRHFGYPSILAYLEDRLGIGPRTARDHVRVARELGSLPQLEAALEGGVISHSAVRELCRVADANTEAAWLERIRGKNQRQVEDLVRGHRKGAHPDDDKQDLETRRVIIEMSPATFALYRQTIAALSTEVGRQVEEDEAIATMCRRTLEPADGEPSRAAFQVAVTVCATCKRGWQDGAGAIIEIEPADVEVALCDAEHIGSLDADQPARAKQDVSPATRRLVWRRDHGKCRVEGCRSARNLDVHHVVHRADGGSHDASNLVVMCSGCHTALHRGWIEVSGIAPSFVFRHRSLSTAKRSPPADVPDLDSDEREQRRGESALPTHAAIDPRITLRQDACAGLKASGYSAREASTAVDAAMGELGTVMSLEQLLRVALRHCRGASR